MERLARPEHTTHPIAFGVYELQPETGELRRHGMEVHITRQASTLLLLLLEEPGRLRTREELKQSLWPDESFGDFDHGLNKCVHQLRAALRDPARNPLFIETFAGKGYRFIGIPGTGRSRTSEPNRARHDLPLAVLRFVPCGEDPELRFLADAVTCSTIDALAALDNVRVLAFSQVAGLPPAPHPASSTLHRKVRAVITGTVAPHADTVQIRAEMAEGRDGTQIWAILRGLPWTELARCPEIIATEIAARVQTLGARKPPARERSLPAILQQAIC